MNKKVLLMGLVGLVASVFVFDISVPSLWGRGNIPLISTGSFMLIVYGLVAKSKPN
jgi:hypothetical protein